MNDNTITKLKLIPYGIFNINSAVEGNGVQITDNQLIYCSENLIIAYEIQSGGSFILQAMPTDGMVIDKLQINSQRNMLAVSQKGSEGVITVFAIVSQHFSIRLKKINKFSGCSQKTKGYSRLSFSNDSFYLGAISEFSESQLLIYSIQTGHIVFNVSLIMNKSSIEIMDLAFNPDERNKIAVVGNGALNIFYLSQRKKLRKSLGGFNIKSLKLISVAWMISDRIIAGTADGKVVITENGIFLGIFNILSDDIIYYSFYDEIPSKNTDAYGESFLPVISIIPFYDGFLIYCGLGIMVFEKYCDGWLKKKFIFRLPNLNIEDDRKVNRFIHYLHSSSQITISNNEKDILMLQILESHIELIRKFTFMYHDGPLSSLASCVLLPHVLTSGENDKKLVLWNYQYSLALKYWIFDNYIIRVAIHPSGLFCLIMFKEKFCFCYINLKGYFLDILDYFEYSASVGTFAESGGFFAVGNSFSIDVYSSMTLKKLKTIVINTTPLPLNFLCFANGDRYIWSYGHNTNLKKWHIFKGKVCWELRESFSTIDGSTMAVCKNDKIYLADSNGSLVEIKDSGIQKKLVCSGGIQCITASADAVILGDKRGLLLFLSCSLNVNHYGLEQVFINRNGISQILAVTNDQIMVASSNGGFYMFIFLIVNPFKKWKMENNLYKPFLGRLYLGSGNSFLPRNNKILNDCLKQLSGCIEEHRKNNFLEEYNYSILQINHNIERVLKNLFIVKAIAHYYRKAIRTFDIHTNKFFEVSRLCLGKIDDFYKQKLQEFSLCMVGNQGLGNLMRPIDKLMRFINEKFFTLYKMTKLIIQKIISKAVNLSKNHVHEILNKILTLNRHLSKCFYISNNPLNFARFSICRLFHKRLMNRNLKYKYRKSSSEWETEMLLILKLEKKLYARLMSQIKINSVLCSRDFMEMSYQKRLSKKESGTPNQLTLIKTYNKLVNCLVTSNFIFKNQMEYMKELYK